MIEIEYRDRYTAYLDVLGFKEKLIAGGPTLEEYFNTVLQELTNLKSRVGKSDLEYILISDAIVLSFPLDQEGSAANLKELLFAISSIQYRLCLIGFWLRGAVSKGRIFIKPENMVAVGQGLVNAYQLEQLAKYPRVILDPKIFEFLKIGPDRLRTLIDGPMVHNGSPTILYNQSTIGGFVPAYHKEEAVFIDYLAHLKTASILERDKFVESIKANGYADQRTFSKFRWILDYAICRLDESIDKNLIDRLFQL